MGRLGGKDRGLFERPVGSGVWWIRYNDCHGREHKEKAGTKSQAKSLYTFRQGEKLQGKLPDIARLSPTITQVVERYKPESSTKARKSRLAEERHARLWVEAFGKVPIKEITPGDVEAWKSRRLQKVQAATVNRSVAYLKTLLNKAVRDGLLERNPVAAGRVKMLREAPAPDRIVSPKEEAAIACQLEPDMARAFTVALYTGMRRAEQFGLTRRDVDLGKKLIRLGDRGRTTKGGGRQFVHLGGKALKALRTQLDSHKLPWVWPNEEGTGPLVEDTALNRLVRACSAVEDASLSDVRWHTLRHTYISRLCMLGVPLPTVQKLARHKSITMTLRYAHLCPDHTDQALEKLDRFE